MITLNATEARKQWSTVIDEVVREKPVFVKRTRDRLVIYNVTLALQLLECCRFTAVIYPEHDGSITLSLNEIDLVENAATLGEARRSLAASILEYAAEYYEHYAEWSVAPNRKAHIPYVMKALLLDDISSLEDSIACQNGET